MNESPKYTIVVPVFNSEATLTELIERIENVMTNHAPYELLLIDDLSSDNSWEVMKILKNGRKHIRLLRFTKNFGQAAALICGMREAKAAITVSIDDDLQFQPEDISKLIEHYNPEKHYAVFGVPKNKKKGFLKNLISLTIDRLIRKMAFKDANSSLRFSSFRISAKKTYARDNYSEKGMKSLHVFFNMVSPQLIDFIEVDYQHRKIGKSNYTFMKRVRILLEIVITLTELPILWFIYLVLAFALLFIYIGVSMLFDLTSWSGDFRFLILVFLGFNMSFGFVFLFVYLRKIFLSNQGADVYAIWQEA